MLPSSDLFTVDSLPLTPNPKFKCSDPAAAGTKREKISKKVFVINLICDVFSAINFIYTFSLMTKCRLF